MSARATAEKELERSWKQCERLDHWERWGKGAWGLGVSADVLAIEQRLDRVETAMANAFVVLPTHDPNVGSIVPVRTQNHDAAPAARPTESEALRAGPPQPTDGTGTTLLTEAERLAIYTAAEWLSKLARSAATERAKELFDHATTLLGLAGRMP